MDLTLRELCYLAVLVGLLLLFQKLKRVFFVFSLVVLPVTFCHELCHLGIGTLLGGRPTAFSVLPRREAQGYVLGSVTFANIRWYNAFFLGTAPLLLLPAAYGLLQWRLRGQPMLGWGEALALYGIANLVYAALPSWQDLKIAARSPVGWFLLAGAGAWAWHHLRAVEPAITSSHQLQVPRLARLEATLRNPCAHVSLGEAYEVG